MSGRQPDLADLKKRMDSALDVLRKELQGLRTGRASASLLEPITVEAYGSEMPLTQVGTVNVPEPRMLTVQVWDRGMVKAVEKAIRNSSLGLNPAVDGQLIRVPLPELTQERRQRAGQGRAQICRAGAGRRPQCPPRRHGPPEEDEKDGDISQDEHKQLADEVQKLTDQHIEAVNQLLEQKEKDILQV